AALGLSFAILAYLVLLAFPAGVIFALPIIVLYCLGFLLTATSKKEFLWKMTTSCFLASVMVITKIPNFFMNLYNYSWGSYFLDLVSTTGPIAIFRGQSLAFAFVDIDLRILLFIALSLGTSCFLVLRSSGALRRVAFSVLFVELGILLIGSINTLTF